MCFRARLSHFAFPILAVFLAACAPRGPLLELPSPPDAAIAPLFVASVRAPGRGGEPGPNRADRLTYSRMDVSIPVERAAGSVTFATSPETGSTGFSLAAQESYGSRDAFRRAVSSALREEPRQGRDVTLYVHGFNNTYAEGVARLAQLTHDLSLPGVGVHFSWASAANPLGYAYDSDSTLVARDRLEGIINDLSGVGAQNVTIVAHSMGAFLVMETLRQMAIAEPGSVSRRVDAIVLVSPDIDIDVFRAQAQRIGTLPDDFIIFSSRRDRALALSARLTGQTERLGTIADPARIGDLRVTIIDVTAFSSGLGHFAPGSSPTLLRILSDIATLDEAF
ncbi:MAG: alpha/beta fold hydrolase, partial [Pseudomonadota bacterium]